jgi:hypothetical protein
MNDIPNQPPPPQPPDDPNAPIIQDIQHQSISARVPEKVAKGVFSTGAIVAQGAQEFVIDFLIRMAPPQQLAARVIIPVPVMPRLIGALQDNIEKFTQAFGPPPALPIPTPQQRAQNPPPNLDDLYNELKIADDQLCGAYANVVRIVHTPAEFCFDFITAFYPRSAVSCRVYLSAPQAPRFLDTLKHSFQQFQRKLAQQQQPPPPQPPPQT